jgi:hypothetical protein
MRTRSGQILVAAAALVALALPATAEGAPTWQKIIQDCQYDGELKKGYSRKDLKKAKKKLPADAAEYGDCAEAIEAALTAPAGGRGGGPDSAAARQQDQQELAALIRDRPKPTVDVGGKKVTPDEDSGLFDVAGSSNGLPPPLLFALIAIGLIAMGGGAYALRRRIPALSRIPLPRISLSRVPFPRLRR